MYEQVARLEYLLSNFIGAIDQQLATIVYNKLTINQPKTLLFSEPNYDIYVLHNKEQASTLLTKGVPFSTLEPYIPTTLHPDTIRELTTGVQIDIKVGGYVPVQTRTRLIFNEELQKNFLQVLYRAVFAAITYKSTSDTFWADFYIEGYSSRSEAQQLIINPISLTTLSSNQATPTLIFSHVLYNEQQSFASVLNKAIEVLSAEKMNATQRIAIMKLLNTEITTSVPQLKIMIANLVRGWLETKNTAPRKPPPPPSGGTLVVTPGGTKQSTKKREQQLALDTRYPGFKLFIVAWVNQWIAVGVKAQVKGFKNDMVSKVQLARVPNEANKNALAWYNRESREVYLATTPDYYTAENIVRILRAWLKVVPNVAKQPTIEERLKSLEGNELWNRVFSYTFPASVLIHELEHARRQQSGHESISVALYPNDLAETRTFDQAANSVYKYLIEQGFYQALLNAQ